MLAVTDDELDRRGWQVARGFGGLLAGVLTLNLIAVVIWDVNHLVSGGAWISDSTRGLWPIFAGQWIGPFVTNTLILAIASGLTLFALIRNWLIQPEKENRPSAQQLATKDL